MPRDKWERAVALGAGVLLFGWFLWLVRPGLASWFDADDLMNLHYYWSRPTAALVKANFAFWSSYYRPGGGLFYRAIYALWGFDPLPFRIGATAFLCVDFVLLALVVRQLTGSRWAALVALLVFGTHPAFSPEFLDTGTIYDVLVYAFFWGAFAWYVHIRGKERFPAWGSLAALIVLFIAALNSKEIAVVLPVAVALYELIWHPPTGWTPAGLWRWILREGRFAAIGVLLDAGFVLGKRFGPDSLWSVEAYKPHYSWGAYFESLAHYFKELVYKPEPILTWHVCVLLAAMLAVALLSRRRFLLWGWAFIMAGVLPLAFIPGRGGFAYMVPSVGWAVYLAGLLDWLMEKLAGRRVWLRYAVQALVLIVLFRVLAPWQQKWIYMHARAAHEMQERFHGYENQLQTVMPTPRKGARILLLSDADGHDDYDVYFLIRLMYGDTELQAERMTVWRASKVAVDVSKYDYVLDWVGGRFVVVQRK